MFCNLSPIFYDSDFDKCTEQKKRHTFSTSNKPKLGSSNKVNGDGCLANDPVLSPGFSELS